MVERAGRRRDAADARAVTAWCRFAVRRGLGAGVGVRLGVAVGAGATVARPAVRCVRRPPEAPLNAVTRTAATTSTPAADTIIQRLAMSTLDLDR